MRNSNVNIILSLIFCVIFILVSQVHAATKEAYSVSSTDDILDHYVAKITIYLSLTDKQAQQIKPIIKEDMEKRSQIITENKGSQEAAKSALEDLITQTDHKLSQYLSDAQMKKWDQMQKAILDQPAVKKGGKGGRGGRKMFGRGAL